MFSILEVGVKILVRPKNRLLCNRHYASSTHYDILPYNLLMTLDLTVSEGDRSLLIRLAS